MENIAEKLGRNNLKTSEPMSKHTNFKVGGPADFYFEALSVEDLEQAVKACIETGLSFFILGLGANILVGDKGIRGLVIKNNANKVRFLPHSFVEAESGVNTAQLLRKTTEQGLSGLERLMKVPGTVGGAVFMNAGDTGKKAFIGDLVKSIKIMDQNAQVKTISADEAEFNYRGSRFQKTNEVILSVILQLKKVSKEEIEENLRDILVRKKHHPSGLTVGSTFKNPPGNYAGKLIEEAGLKGHQVGQVKFSENHANFIINLGGATASEIKDLISLAKAKVREKFNIELEEEVRYIGDFS